MVLRTLQLNLSKHLKGKLLGTAFFVFIIESWILQTFMVVFIINIKIKCYMKMLGFSEHLTISVDVMDHQPWEEHRFTVRNCKYIRVLLKRAMPG